MNFGHTWITVTGSKAALDRLWKNLEASATGKLAFTPPGLLQNEDLARLTELVAETSMTKTTTSIELRVVMVRDMDALWFTEQLSRIHHQLTFVSRFTSELDRDLLTTTRHRGGMRTYLARFTEPVRYIQDPANTKRGWMMQTYRRRDIPFAARPDSHNPGLKILRQSTPIAANWHHHHENETGTLLYRVCGHSSRGDILLIENDIIHHLDQVDGRGGYRERRQIQRNDITRLWPELGSWLENHMQQDQPGPSASP